MKWAWAQRKARKNLPNVERRARHLELGAAPGQQEESGRKQSRYLANPPLCLPELLGIPHLIPGHGRSHNKQCFPLAVPGSRLVWYLAQGEHGVGEGPGTRSSPVLVLV